MKYLFSDPHFGHDRLREKARSQFKTIQEHDEAIVKNWNKVINSDDTVVYILGDLGFKEEVSKYIPQMRGYKILILGNHDNYSKTFYNELFDEVYDHPLFIHSRMVLSHIPIPVEDGVFNIHGHTHDIDLDSEYHINVSAERIDYKPIPLEKMQNKLFGKYPKPNIKFLQEWYKDIQIAVKVRDDLTVDERGLIDPNKSLETIRERIAKEKGE